MRDVVSYPMVRRVSLCYSVTFYVPYANQVMIKLQIQTFDKTSESYMRSV